MGQTNILMAVFILMIAGCKAHKPLQIVSNPLYNYVPKAFRYDTLHGVFYYENFIKSHIEGDAVVKGSGFIFADSVSKSAYENAAAQRLDRILAPTENTKKTKGVNK